MSQDRPLNNLDEVARRLRSLEPAGRIDRDRVMYLAGRQSAGAKHWAWPAATGLAGAVAAVLAVLLAMRPDATVTPVVARPPTADHPTARDLVDITRPFSQFRLQQELLGGLSHDRAETRLHTGSDALRPRDFSVLSRDGVKL
jgi:hypothetical protein